MWPKFYKSVSNTLKNTTLIYKTVKNNLILKYRPIEIVRCNGVVARQLELTLDSNGSTCHLEYAVLNYAHFKT